jgi:N-acetylgalactosamine-N,N'-diacetylbacillosaminyl-diphospho-undecaprenol 4-alpha-N-acetylgalactosaminyltransferase
MVTTPETASAAYAAGKPARVLFLINDLRMGGAERALVTYVNHLRTVRPVIALIQPDADLARDLRPGIAPLVLSARRPRRDGAAAAGSAPRGRPRGTMLLESPGLVWRAFRLARVAHATGCSVVSTFLNRSHTIALLAKLFFAPRLRIVINVHEMLSDHLSIHFAPAERYVMRAFIARTFPLAERIVAVSDGVRDDLASHFGLDAGRITVVHNPLDLDRIRRAGMEDGLPPRSSSDGPLVVGVGRLVKLKAFDLLIRAMARVPESLRARLLLIGDGEERRRLEDLVAQLHLADRVDLLGMQTNPWKYMARADVVAVPSRTEAFPNVIGEALALGRPVVAARCSDGIAEYLNAGECGVIVPPDDVDAMAGAIERLLRDAGLRQQLGERGSRRVQVFAVADAVSRYETILLQASRSRR